ncbi:6-phosphogluconolactonase [Chryseobacterium wangxinyae]|uniref:6-phosphogluconolactonase n=1 Tax=Chryseobacterium sp. CY350 TaxID=2997336 RepID=UPI00226D6BE5|nr:6-phosphogluconolactonase [Chryseobacterium sp. CY350]MCY0979343.1 6-phosphogluconolactonase [Chryseobacterium sp. CY350]WBZ95975.1 6-phosphogluconolactonase [Chryseobacterium sp. CY350]
MKLTVVDHVDQLYTKTADLFVEFAAEAIANNGKFVVALSGGSSPKSIFELLSTKAYSDKIEWDKVWFFWVDERWVSLDNEKSNANMTFESLLNHVPVHQNQIFPMFKENITPEDYAAEYESKIREVLGEKGQFDCILLGMGDDGHTASLFPGENILEETTKWVDAYYLSPQEMYRITLTAPIINMAKNVLVVTFGAQKRHALNEIINGEFNPNLYPLQLIKPQESELQILTTSETLL